MSQLHRITSDPAQCGGRPCLRSLRIRVKDVLDLLAAGATREEVLGEYPYLEAEDITAALEYAALRTEAMNAVAVAVGPEPDDFTAAAARQALNRAAEW